MKGCLDIFIKSSTFFASYIVFQCLIGFLILGEPPLSNEKQLKERTKEEHLEVSQYHGKFKISFAISGFLSLPLSVISTYLIFRKIPKIDKD